MLKLIMGRGIAVIEERGWETLKLRLSIPDIISNTILTGNVRFNEILSLKWKYASTGTKKRKIWHE